MIVTIYNEQGLLEVEAHVEVFADAPEFGGGLIAEVARVWIEGEPIAPGRLPLDLLDELEQQALEEANDPND